MRSPVDPESREPPSRLPVPQVLLGELDRPTGPPCPLPRLLWTRPRGGIINKTHKWAEGRDVPHLEEDGQKTQSGDETPVTSAAGR